VCALAVYFFTSQFAYHALQGITIPLAVLAVGGWPRLVRLAQPLTATWLTTALVLIAIVPGAAYQLKTFRDSERSGAAPYTLGTDDHDALVYLDRAGGAGGVLARDEIGMAVPAFTGRRTWVGEWTWTPDFARRVALAGRLMSGQMSPTEARRFVRSTGAGFVLADCGTSDKLQMLIAPLISSWVRYGCASVYQLR
jgi:hypothetical protein